MSQLRVIDLCCGAGLFSAGFQRAGFKIIMGMDLDPVALSSFQSNFPDSVSWQEDIMELESLPKCDIVIGGIPCQPFSRASRSPNHLKGMVLVEKFINLAIDSKVKYWIMEEVPPVAEFIQDRVPRLEIWECSKFGARNLRPRLFAGQFPDPVQAYAPVPEPAPTVMATESQMSIQEMKDLQGIPSWMQFHGTDAEVRRQIGNGVPLQMGESLAKGITYHIQGIEIHGHQPWHTTTASYHRKRSKPRSYKSTKGWLYCWDCKSNILAEDHNGV